MYQGLHGRLDVALVSVALALERRKGKSGTIVSYFFHPFLHSLCLVFGMCLTSAVSYEARKRRLWERLRLSFLSFWSESMDKGMKRLDKYRKPTLMDTIDKTAVSGTMPKSNSKPQQQTEMEALPPSAIRQEAVSPNWCATSGMRVTIITLFPGSEIVPQPSLGVEFYYVVKGKGEYLKEGIDAAFSMAAGSCLVVDPNT